ncbi:DUF6314 family protein [Curtobacterium sp. MCBA15_001]|uniref:DUF6314 family protein n=1 Tax=Curtobacterium sp. MCBA15_001 TaxID=1898731 RepID=UPI0009177AEE|nr:DUF6314 family protein [Curtobacterium sp. MCBA15_001]OIH92560.1 hypothetical protein BIU90_11900 [Curtobacterium sp. MCBA15_001]
MVPTDLLGSWTLRRTLHDRRAGLHGTVTGTTTLRAVRSAAPTAPSRPSALSGPSALSAPDDVDQVEWTETGTMVFDGRTVPVTRTLLVRRTEDLGWRVHFADGRVFHDWVWGDTVVHACAPDDYTGLLSGDATRWTVRWEAVGPAKDHRLDSVLERRTDAAD